jgi:hypothetical protein
MRKPLLSLLLLICALGASGCAVNEQKLREQFSFDGRADNIESLTITTGDDAKRSIDMIPDDEALEKLAAVTDDGRTIFYAALADGEVGGVLFVDGKLHGILSPADAQTFYSCRGYVSTTRAHWAGQADAWLKALISASVPAERVKLNFSGNAKPRSIKGIANSPVLHGLSIFDLTTSPVGLLRKLNSARERMQKQDDYDKAMESLKAVALYTKENELAKVMAPEDMSFGETSLILSYPQFAFDFNVRDGKVRLAQQPSFRHMSHARPAMFYMPDMNWKSCSSETWRSAAPPDLTVKSAMK